MLNSIQPLDRLLCNLLRLDESPPVSLEGLSDQDWQALLQRARQQGLGPLLNMRLRALPGAAAIPEAALQALQRQHLESGVSALQRLYRLESVLETFQQADIPVIALKGVHLAATVYEDDSLRPMADCDLLLHPRDLEQAERLLHRLGYSNARRFWIDYEMRVSHELPPFCIAGGPTVEVHWTLLVPSLPFSIDLEGLWQRAIPLQVGSQCILGLSPEDLLLHLCLHGPTQHLMRTGVRLIYDVAVTVQHYQAAIDWGVLEQHARQWRAIRPAHLMLYLAKELFGAPVPPAALQALQPEPDDPKVVEIATQLAFPALPKNVSFSPGLASLAEAPGLRDRLRLIWERVFVPPEKLARDYPVLPGSPRVWLYYPVHLVDLFKKHLPSVWKLVRGQPESLAAAQYVYHRQALEEELLARLTSNHLIPKA
ncbi:MAG: nucleotidyltransferase family protein [Chloroflexota bacterium]